MAGFGAIACFYRPTPVDKERRDAAVIRAYRQPRDELRTPLEFPQVLPQRGPHVLSTRYAALLEQRDNLLYERTNVARPETLPDGKAIAADRLDGARQAVSNALRCANEWHGVETDLAGGDLPQG